MILFKYPNNEVGWLADFNRLVDTDGFQIGAFGLAVDVWRDNELLYSSYDHKQSEALVTWCERNHPQIANPEYDKVALGIQIAAPERFGVPTRAALDRPMSLTACREVIKAALATAQYPFDPDLGNLVPKENALRQRLHQADQDWICLRIYDQANRIALRALIARMDRSVEAPQSRYRVELQRREGSTIVTRLEARQTEMTTNTADLTDKVQRKPILKMAKKVLGLVGKHGRITHDEPSLMLFRIGDEPFNIICERVHDFAPPQIPADLRGFDL